MNESAKAACALVACETEFLVRRVAKAFQVRRMTAALERVAVWAVPPTPAPARVHSRRPAPRWHLLLSIVAAAAAVALDPAAVTAQCCGGCGSSCGGPSFFGSPGSGCCGSPCGGQSFFGSPCGAPSFFGSPCGSGCCGSPCGRPACGGSPCGGPACCGSPCGAPSCGSPYGSAMPFFGRPCGGCGGGCGGQFCGGGCPSGCGCQRMSFAFLPGGGCPSCGPSCGSPCGCPCGPSCGLACGPPCGCGMPGCGMSGCGSCGPACGSPGAACGPPVGGTPMPTYDGPPGPQSSSSNKSGPPPIDQGDGPPPGPPTPIRQRSGNTPPDNSQKFERLQPTGSLDAPSSLDMSQASADPVGVVVRRYFRQTVSAGFRTHVAVAQSERTASRSTASRARATRDFEEPRIVARTD
jgi:hypothetical protein